MDNCCNTHNYMAAGADGRLHDRFVHPRIICNCGYLVDGQSYPEG